MCVSVCEKERERTQKRDTERQRQSEAARLWKEGGERQILETERVSAVHLSARPQSSHSEVDGASSAVEEGSNGNPEAALRSCGFQKPSPTGWRGTRPPAGGQPACGGTSLGPG